MALESTYRSAHLQPPCLRHKPRLGLRHTTMVRSRDIAPVDDEPFVNVLGDLHSDLGDALENLISHIRSRRDADTDDEDIIPIHTVLLHICRPPTCPVVQQGLQTGCPIIRFLIVNSLKSDPSSTNIAFEHVRRVMGLVAILQYWWRCTILMQAVQSSGSPAVTNSGLHFGSPRNLCHLDVVSTASCKKYYRE
jgi:hypothetical protein